MSAAYTLYCRKTTDITIESLSWSGVKNDHNWFDDTDMGAYSLLLDKIYKQT